MLYPYTTCSGNTKHAPLPNVMWHMWWFIFGFIYGVVYISMPCIFPCHGNIKQVPGQNMLHQYMTFCTTTENAVLVKSMLHQYRTSRDNTKPVPNTMHEHRTFHLNKNEFLNDETCCTSTKHVLLHLHRTWCGKKKHALVLNAIYEHRTCYPNTKSVAPVHDMLHLYRECFTSREHVVTIKNMHEYQTQCTNTEHAAPVQNIA